MKKFCPKCGKTIEEGVFCKDCNPNVLEFKPINVKLCPSGKYFFRGKWSRFDDLKKITKNVFEKTLNKKVQIIKGLEDYPELLQKTGLKKDLEIILKVEGEEYLVNVNVEVTSSPSFCKVGTSYFEGILQLRTADDEVKKFVNKTIKELPDVFVNDVKEFKEGMDYYFVKKKFINRVADKIVSEFGGFMSANAKLFTQDKQSGKELFRVNTVVHVFPYKKGDVIKKKDDLLLIRETGKNINAFDFINKKKVSFKYNPEEQHEYDLLKKQKTTVINNYPEITALSNESYEVIKVENPLNLVIEKNQKVSIVEYEGRAFLIK